MPPLRPNLRLRVTELYAVRARLTSIVTAIASSHYARNTMGNL
jgi:hypothetical protein